MSDSLAPGDFTQSFTCSMADYHADALTPESIRPAMSASLGELALNRSPAHALLAMQEAQVGEKEYKRHFAFGTAMHSLVLRDAPEDAIYVLPEEYADFRKKDAQMLRDEAMADGKAPLLHHQWQEARNMRNVVITDPYLSRFLSAGNSEVSLVWHDKEFGIGMRCRFDFLPENLIGDSKTIQPCVDYKTCESIESFLRNFLPNYSFRLALYYRGLAAYLGEDLPPARFVLLLQEKSPPYAAQAALITLNPGEEMVLSKEEAHLDALTRGTQELTQAARIWNKCVEKNFWPFPVSVVRAPDDYMRRKRDPWRSPLSTNRGLNQ